MQCDRGVFRQRGQRGGGCPERAPGDDVLRSFHIGHKDRRVGWACIEGLLKGGIMMPALVS